MTRNPKQWPPHKLVPLVALAGCLAAGALAGLAWSVGFHKALAALVHPHWVWLGIALAGELVAYAGYTVAYREVARAEGGAELEVPQAAALVAAGFGAFVHGGGFALDRAALMRAGLSERNARRRVLGLSALEYAVLAPGTCVAAVVVLLFHPTISASLTLPWLIGVPVGAALALTALHFKASISSWRKIGPAFARRLEALELVLAIVRSPRRYPYAIAGTLAYWGGDIFCLWSTLHAFSAHTPPVAQLVVGYATGYALTRRALPLGGAGVVEALLPFALGWLKIALLPALLAVFAYRLINLWLPLIPALAGLPTLQRLELRHHAGTATRSRGARTAER
jgi:uncharacterized membrane protein YbhN (UPF0104 family)